MRVRKVKGAEEYIAKHLCVIKDDSNLSQEDQYQIEIGCGKGDYILQRAKANPDIKFIAVEKNPSVLYYALKKFDNEKLSNLYFMNADAINLPSLLCNIKFDVIYLNFSDPWPKKRNHKRRLSAKNFIKVYDYLLKDYALIQMKTDNYPLFIYSVNSFIEHKYFVKELDTNFDSKANNDFVSEYEKKFKEKLVKINYLLVQKVGKNDIG